MKFSRAKPTSQEAKSDKVSILRKLKEKEELELNTSEDFISNKSFDFADETSEIGLEPKANDALLNDVPAEPSKDTKIDQFF